MSFDMAFWKRSNRTRTAMLAETYQNICDGRDHPSMCFFDGEKVIFDLAVKFGDCNADDGVYSLDSGKGTWGNWIIVNAFYSKAREVLNGCIEMAIANNIMLYDPQVKGVYNNHAPAGLLENLPNISNISADRLRTAGIYESQDLYAAGSQKAFMAICQKE